MDKQYLAGLFDAEGCLNMQYENDRYYRHRFTIHSCHKQVIDEIASLYKVSQGSRKKKKVCYYLECSKRETVQQFVSDILPHLKGKRIQAEAMLASLDGKIDPIEAFKTLKEQKSLSWDMPWGIKRTPFVVDENHVNYLAGIFDGDGYMGIQKGSDFKYGGHLKLTLTHYENIKQVWDIFGGILKRVVVKGNRKPQYEFSLWKKTEVESFCKAILPYSREKKHQVELMLDHIKHPDAIDYQLMRGYKQF